MNSRERVLTTLAHHEPDRVPLSLGGTASSFTDKAYFQLKDYLGLKGEVKPYRYGHTGNYYDDHILEALGTDYRYLVLTYPDDSHLTYLADGTFVDEWGIRKKEVGGYVSRVGHPLADATLEDLDSYPWPDPYSADMRQLATGLHDRARYLSEETDCAIVARAAMSTAFLENGAWLCGYEEFLVKLMIDKPFAAKLIEKILQVQLGMYELLLDGVGEYFHIVETAEDYGMQSGLLISPAIYREMIMPARQRLNAFIKNKAPNARILHHSCGGVEALIPDLIASGIDILNPIQPSAVGMDSAHLKARWGNQLCFDGGIDMLQAIAGPLKGLEVEVARRILALAPGGGYSLGTSNHIQEDVPPRNVVALFEMAKDLGRYPLDRPRLAGIIQTASA